MTLAQLEEEFAARGLDYVSVMQLPATKIIIAEAYYPRGGSIGAGGETLEEAVLALLALIPRCHPVPVPSKDVIL